MKSHKLFATAICFAALLLTGTILKSQEFHMPVTGIDTIFGSTGIICDDGGPDANYSDNSDGTVIIYPPSKICRTVLNFTTFDLADNDTLFIYYGDSDSTLYFLYGAFAENPGTIESDYITGAFRLHFVSNSEGNAEGFEANITYDTIPAPDLTITDAYLSIDSINPSQNIYFYYTLENIGDEIASYSYTGFFLSTDTILDESDEYIDYDYRYSISPGGSGSYSEGFIPYTGSLWGELNIIAVADYNNYLQESDETNNTISVPVYISEPTKDLSPNYLNLPENTITQYSLNTLNYSIRNLGNSMADSVNTDIFLSLDKVIDGQDIFLGRSSLLNISANSYRNTNYSLDRNTIDTLTEGIYYLILETDADSRFDELDEINNTGIYPVLVIQGIYDFTIDITSILPYSYQLDTLRSIRVYYTAANAGLTNAESIPINFYLSEDNSFDEAEDTYLGYETIYQIEAQSEYSTYDYLYMPPNFSLDEFYLFAIIDYENNTQESDEDNNISSMFYEVTEPFSDLAIENVIINPDSVPVSGEISTSFTITNLGTSYSYAYYGIYLSDDEIIDPDDVQLVSYYYSLNAGSSYQVNRTIYLQETISEGEYYILYQVDAENSVDETDEMNNFCSKSLKIYSFDLIEDYDVLISDLQITTDPIYAGNSLYTQLTCINVGLEIPTSVYYSYYLSTDSVLDVEDLSRTLYTNYSYSSWPTGSYRNMSNSLSLPDTLSAGKHYLIAKIDSRNSVFEINEENNVLIKPFQVSEMVYDIEAISITCDGVLIAGNTAQFRTRLRNNGSTYLSGIEIGYYVSDDMIFDTDDQLLGIYDGYSISPGYTSTLYRDLTIPQELTQGIYYLIVIADHDSLFDETSEINNMAYTRFGVFESDVDYSIQNTTLSKTSFSANEYVSFNVTLANSGSTMGSNIPVGCYLSDDENFDPGVDVLLDENIITGISANSTYTSYMYFYLPGDITNGDYYFLFVADGENLIEENNEDNNVMSYPIEIVPSFIDLEMRTVYADYDSVSVGGRIYVYSYVYNIGNLSTSGSRLAYYLSTDTIVSEEDILLSNTSLYVSAGSYDYNSANLNIPAIETGQYYLIFFADYLEDVDELDEENNTNWLPLKVVESNIDLVISSASITATSVAAGNSTYISYTIENTGYTTSNASQVGVYLSLDSTFNQLDDAFLGYDNIYEIYGNSYQNLSVSITVPSTIPYGTYRIILVADHDNVNFETNELNNTYLFDVIVTEPVWDLTVTNTYVNSDSYAPGDYLYINCEVVNIGNATTVNTSTLGYYLSTDNIFDPDDYLLGTDYVGNISSGSYSYESISLNLPTDLQDESYYILFVADIYDDMDESDEGNNLAFEHITVIFPSIDLTVDSISVAQDIIISGEYVDVYAMITNLGSTSVSSPTVGLAISDNMTWDETDELLTWQTIPYLDGGGYSSSVYFNAFIPSDIDQGYYYLLVKADHNSSIVEEDESNNVLYISVQVVQPGSIDLFLSDVSLQEEYDPATGGDYVLNFNIHNEGAEEAVGVFTGIYLSADDILQPDDTFVMFDSVFVLGPDSIAERNITVTLPADTLGNCNYIILQADFSNIIEESDESNNLFVLELNTTDFIHPAESNKVSLYPNPANDRLYLRNPADFKSYRIVSSTGAVEQTDILTEGINEIVLNKLKPGQYILILYSTDKVTTQKFIILH